MEKASQISRRIHHVIFDLSEVIIYGLSGFQGPYAQQLGIRAETSFDLFGGPHLQDLLRGAITEEAYLVALMEKNAWDLGQVSQIKKLIRDNFHQYLPGTLEIATALSKTYALTLLSDHAKEWAAYICDVHPFIRQIFSHVYFSCDYGKTKRDASLFEMVLRDLRAEPAECLFVDDSQRNISVAASIGLEGIRFIDAVQLREELVNRGLLEDKGIDETNRTPILT